MKYPIALIGLLFFSLNSFASLKIASYNIRNFDSGKNKTNKIKLEKILNDLNSDIVVVEEIVNKNSFKRFISNSFPEYKVKLSSCGGRGNQKIGFMYKKDRFDLKKFYEDSRISNPSRSSQSVSCGRLRPAVIGEFYDKNNKKDFTLIGLHLKAGSSKTSFFQRWKQYDTLSEIVSELKNTNHKNILILGDLNTTGYKNMDLDYDMFQNLLSEINMSTISEKIMCTSYWSGFNRQDDIEEASTLDHIIYPSTFMGFATNKIKVHSHCKRAYCNDVSAKDLGLSYKTVSDHCPISITFK